MSESQTQENQQELFTDFKREPNAGDRVSGIVKAPKPILISTTLEQILLAGIVMILFFCLIFFLGVMRGRSVSAALSAVPASTTPSAPSAVPAAPGAPARPILRVMTVAAEPKKAGSFVVMSENPAKPYTIQVLTTKKKAYAEDEAAALRKSGFASYAAKSGEFYVVCVGSYTNKEEARKDLSYFGAKYKGRYLRRK